MSSVAQRASPAGGSRSPPPPRSGGGTGVLAAGRSAPAIRRSFVPIAVAGLVLSAGLARGETFVFRDPARPQLRGKVLVEFPDLLLVALDGEAPRFIARNELEAVVDEAGGRWASPPPGTFARLGETPVAAGTDLSGRISLRRGATDPTPVKEEPLLLRAGDSVLTGDEDGLCRVVLPSGATAKLGPACDLLVPEPSSAVERLALERGEALIETALRPLSVQLWAPPREVTLELGGGARAGLGRADAASAQVTCHDGSVDVVWPDARVVLEPGAGLAIERSAGGWRVTADLANANPVDVRRRDGVERLAPGASLVFGDQGPTAAGGDAWRILRARGELLLSRAGGPFVVLPIARRYDVTLGPGDALRTAPDGEAALTRADGAQVTLLGATHQVFADALRLEGGRLVAEAGEAPLALETPGGVALLRRATIAAARVGARPAGGGEGRAPAGRAVAVDVLDLEVKGGSAEVPLGPGAVARLDAGAKVRVTHDPLAPEQDGRVACEVLTGAALVVSRPLGPDEVDPGFRVPLVAGRSVGVSLVGRADIAPIDTGEQVARVPTYVPSTPPRADRAATTPPTTPLTRPIDSRPAGARPSPPPAGLAVDAEEDRLAAPIGGGPEPRFVALHLAGERTLVFVGPAGGATVDPGTGELGLPDGSRLALVERLWLALDRDQDRALLRFRKGPRLRLDAQVSAVVHNPTLDLVVPSGAGAGEPLATIELHGPLGSRLGAGTAFAAASLATRRDDRFEVPRGARVVLDRQPATDALDALTRFAVGDGRRLWVEDGAPPVHARLVDALGRLFLTMPGTPPLGLSGARGVTVLATKTGEFVILSDDALNVDRRGLELLSDTPDADSIARDRSRDLLDVPPEDSPSGP